MISMETRKRRKNWLEFSLPFVAKSASMKVRWLRRALTKKVLSPDEITPYVRLLLQDVNAEEEKELLALLSELDDELLNDLLAAADIHDTSTLFRLIPHPTRTQVETALLKRVPPYEKKTQLVRDKVFYAISAFSRDLLDSVAQELISQGKVGEDFQEHYHRFLQILEDEEFLLSLYPNARR